MMSSWRGGVLFACFTALVMLLLSSPVSCELANKNNYSCLGYASSCGNIHNISYPFQLKGDPRHCGHRNYELSCENNRAILQLYSGRYYFVEEINYTDLSMRVVDPGLQKDNCSSLPLYSLTRWDFRDPYQLDNYTDITLMSCATPVMNSTGYIETTSNCSSLPLYSLTFSDFHKGDPYRLDYYYKNTGITFISCATPVMNSTGYIETTAVCNNENTTSLNSSSSPLLLFQRRHTYVVYGDMMASDVEDSCRIEIQSWVTWDSNYDGPKMDNTSFRSIHDQLLYGFHLSWWMFPDWEICSSSSRWCLILINTVQGCIYASCLILLLVAPKILCGSPCVFAFLVYKWRRRHSSMYDSIEEFIQSHNNLMPVRYSYWDIKKMTKGFKDKLGEGGYGSVFKGKLRSGHLVAVKILSNSKANGQDFMNEVATIGRIHHVNVARLIGFCAERSKRALVYDFMPNGSLEKYIFPREEGIVFLSFEKLYAISLGIARGIEYLHGGCDMQILHFDIKPHNILLDEKFAPKVSDFGLAKLYPTDDSIVNLTAARGTMGYMAPELFYKNIGGVSYKADVYSFGMLLMEMASKRKNLNPFVEHLSQIYFPSWIYDQFSDGKDIEMGDATEEERKISKKMIIVAFWCIQLKPTDRPSMSKVVEMLEGNVELQMPPKPFLSPQEIPAEDHGININPTALSISSSDSTDSISLIANAI